MIRSVAIVTVALLLLFSGASYAAGYEDFMAEGKTALASGDLAAAESSFRDALGERPEDLEAQLYLGIALSRQGRSKEAEGALKRALMIDPENPLANLELGIMYYNKQIYPEARDFFENVVSIAPGSSEAETAGEYLDRFKTETARRYLLHLRTGLQYDSNVVLADNNSALPEGISRKSDYRAVIDLSGSYSLLRAKGFVGALGYSLYQSLHRRLSSFNVQSHSAKAGVTWDASSRVRLKGIYYFNYSYIGSRKYSQAHVFSPSVQIFERKGYTTTLEYRYSYTLFKDSDRFASNSDRTGSNHLLGVAQELPLIWKLTSKLGYQFDATDAEKSFQSYDGHKGFLAVAFPVTGNLEAALYGEYYKKDYDTTYPFTGTVRDDKTKTYHASLKHALGKAMDVELSYMRVDNESNIPDFEYERNITSLFLTARY